MCASPEGRIGQTRDWPAAGTYSACSTMLTWWHARPGVPPLQVAFGEGTRGSRPLLEVRFGSSARETGQEGLSVFFLGRRSEFALVPKPMS